uniref:Transposase n=1 Tax=Vespula pensylvanica TaxID=30213 RepID=A0A834JKT5_VESPE|nr:hypothetical protein H0235_017498 [Vespula pensylvanica]
MIRISECVCTVIKGNKKSDAEDVRKEQKKNGKQSRSSVDQDEEFSHDNAAVHSAKTIKQYFSSENITVLNWLAFEYIIENITEVNLLKWIIRTIDNLTIENRHLDKKYFRVKKNAFKDRTIYNKIIFENYTVPCQNGCWRPVEYNARTDIVFIDHQVNAVTYKKVIDEQLKKHTRSNCIFQQNNASVHKVGVVKAFFSSKNTSISILI